MAVMVVLALLLVVAGLAGVTGRGAVDSRDPDFTLVEKGRSHELQNGSCP